MGILAVLMSSCLFIHLGLGETICRILRHDIVILKCVKCLTFWSVLLYSLVHTDLSAVTCVAMSFGSSYASLWIDLILNKIRLRYEKEWELLDAEERESNRDSGCIKQDKIVKEG